MANRSVLEPGSGPSPHPHDLCCYGVDAGQSTCTEQVGQADVFGLSSCTGARLRFDEFSPLMHHLFGCPLSNLSNFIGQCPIGLREFEDRSNGGISSLSLNQFIMVKSWQGIGSTTLNHSMCTTRAAAQATSCISAALLLSQAAVTTSWGNSSVH